MDEKIGFRAGIARQPESLEVSRRAVTQRLDAIDLAPLGAGTVGVVGIGASLYAAIAGAAHLRARGIRAYPLCPSELLDPAIDAADTYIALSASGRSREPVAAMRLRPERLSYAISKAAQTPLAEVVRTVIATQSGIDSSPNTTSYTATLQALGLIADRAAGGVAAVDWQRLPEAAERVLAAAAVPVQRAAALLAASTAIDVVGAGAALGTAGTAALLLREAARVPASSWDTLNFLHGPMEPNDARTGAILFGNEREVQLAQDLAGFSIPSVLVTDRSDLPDQPNLVVIRIPSLGPGLPDAILQIMPAQLIAATLAEHAGLTQTIFRYRQTDTKLPA